MPFRIIAAPASSILCKVSGFNAEAGFTHSLTPARNCTFGCSYCYVPTMGIYGGVKPEDVAHWGQHTTFKSNAAELLTRAIKPDQIIFCSPLVDPFQPIVSDDDPMPAILDVVAQRPPRIFVIQTRGSRILDHIAILRTIAARTTLRISFSITTSDDEIRRAYESLCDSIDQRFDTVHQLVAAGLDTYTTLAPLLPCDPDLLLDRALVATPNPILCDPFHTRATKPRGATTRNAAASISEHLGLTHWHDPQYQTYIVNRMADRAANAGRRFATGTTAFRFLTEPPQ